MSGFIEDGASTVTDRCSVVNPELLCPLETLPNELLDAIIHHLSHEELLYCSQLNSKWFDIVSEKLLRTQSCCLVKDEASCSVFNTNSKIIHQLILRDVHLWKSFNIERVQTLESFFLAGKCTSEDVLSLRSMLGQCSNLMNLTLQTGSQLQISHLEELLEDLKYVKNVCLIFDQIDEVYRNQLMAFWQDCYYFYDEIVIQVLNPSNELIYVCSNNVTLHPYVHANYSKVVFGHVSPPLVESIVSNTRTQIKHLQLDGRENSNDEILRAICDETHLESLTLDRFSFTNQAWGTLFKTLNSKESTLKELNLSKCANITNEEMMGLTDLHLNKLNIDFNACLKMSNIEHFLAYCFHHVLQLKLSFNYNETILNNFLDVFQQYSHTHPPIINHIDLEILRVNHSSQDISKHIEEFKLILGDLATQCCISVNVSEIFTRISC
ncbi:hypothetical protein M8J76_008583 [Diaphorina citri]|nr:hypothetical protein M8J75_002345 [Diaphorina citri]KAI5745139.1 hypothetical protein M8J76_008583 [Diaphorina citri]